MNPRNVCGWFSCECEEKNRLDKMTLNELKNEIYEITCKSCTCYANDNHR